MTDIAPRLQRFLDEERVSYEHVRHRTDYTSKQAAVDTETPEREFAKTVFVTIDGQPAMAVLPASRFVDEVTLRDSLGANEVCLADEDRVAALCPDCAVGAAPPFGNLYDLPVYVSPELREDERITFNAGSHEHALRMAYADFERLVRPRIVRLSEHD